MTEGEKNPNLLAGEKKETGETPQFTEEEQERYLGVAQAVYEKTRPYIEHPELLLPNQPMPENFPGGCKLSFTITPEDNQEYGGEYLVERKHEKFGFVLIPRQVLDLHGDKLPKRVFAVFERGGMIKLMLQRLDKTDSHDPKKPVWETVLAVDREIPEDSIITKEHFDRARKVVDHLAQRGISWDEVQNLSLSEDKDHMVETSRFSDGTKDLSYITPERDYNITLPNNPRHPGAVSVTYEPGNKSNFLELKRRIEGGEQQKQTPERLTDEKLTQLKVALPLLLELGLRQGWDENYQKLAMDQRLAKLLDAETPEKIHSYPSTPMFSTEKAEVGSASWGYGAVWGKFGTVHFQLDRDGFRSADDPNKLRDAPREPLVGSPEDFDRVYEEIKHRVGDELESRVRARHQRIEELKQKLGNAERTGGSNG